MPADTRPVGVRTFLDLRRPCRNEKRPPERSGGRIFLVRTPYQAAALTGATAVFSDGSRRT
ncbi:hypothetical protein KOAAANKH_03657 [Brevundimonas sp. NIBR10]|nr:hypothetical protein KOAAANKH_03657 [Brevundimonas sp. NIBR10]